MDLCDSLHEEIAHEGIKCPICELLGKLDEEHETEIEDLKTVIDGLEEEIKELKEEQE